MDAQGEDGGKRAPSGHNRQRRLATRRSLATIEVAAATLPLSERHTGLWVIKRRRSFMGRLRALINTGFDAAPVNSAALEKSCGTRLRGAAPKTLAGGSASCTSSFSTRCHVPLWGVCAPHRRQVLFLRSERWEGCYPPTKRAAHQLVGYKAQAPLYGASVRPTLIDIFRLHAIINRKAGPLFARPEE